MHAINAPHKRTYLQSHTSTNKPIYGQSCNSVQIQLDSVERLISEVFTLQFLPNVNLVTQYVVCFTQQRSRWQLFVTVPHPIRLLLKCVYSRTEFKGKNTPTHASKHIWKLCFFTLCLSTLTPLTPKKTVTPHNPK